MVVVGDGELKLTAVVSTHNDELVVDEIQNLNSHLPDYARIGRVLCVDNPHTLQDCYTSNGKPIRARFENWANEARDETHVHLYNVYEG